MRLKILYVGPLWHGGTCHQRMVALEELGHNVVGIDTRGPNRKASRLLIRVLSRLGYPPDLTRANQRILHNVSFKSFDVIWVDKGLSIKPRTLIAVKTQHPTLRVVSYSPDDMLNPRNQSRYYIKGLPFYDLHVTTKSYNVAELKALGAREIFFVGNAYDPYTHRPLVLKAEEIKYWGADVGFVGGFERERYQMMLALGEAGIKVVIRGSFWESNRKRHSNLIIKPGDVYADDYARAVCATKVNLCFLRKENRDLQTQRSVEIPACGGFMLAERTDEHLALFEEGKEAEFFSDVGELLSKIRYYLDHEQERVRISVRGRERCLRSGYSNHDRLRAVFHYLYRDCSDGVNLL